MVTPYLILIDDDSSRAFLLERYLKRALPGYSVKRHSKCPMLVEALCLLEPQAVITSGQSTQFDSITLVKELRAFQPHLPIFMITAREDLAPAAKHAGVSGFFSSSDLQAVAEAVGAAVKREASHLAAAV